MSKPKILASALSILVIASAVQMYNPNQANAYNCGGKDTIRNDPDLQQKYANLGIHFYDECAQAMGEQGLISAYEAKRPENALAFYGIKRNTQTAAILSAKVETFDNLLSESEMLTLDSIASDLESRGEINKINHYVMIDSEKLTIEPKEVIEKSLNRIASHIGNQNYIIIISPRKLTDENKSFYENLTEYTTSHDNITFIDFISYAAKSDNQESLYSGDQLSTYGEEKLGNLINDAFPGGVTHIETKNNSSIIWDYFADSEYSNTDSSSEAISALMAAIDSLSGTNPFYRNTLTGATGLFAVKDEAMEQYLENKQLGGLWNTQQDYETTKRMILAQLDFALGKFDTQNNNSATQRKIGKYIDYITTHKSIGHQENLEAYSDELYKIFPAIGKDDDPLMEEYVLYTNSALIAADFTGTNSNIITSKNINRKTVNPINASSVRTRRIVNGRMLMLESAYQDDQNLSIIANENGRKLKNISVYFASKYEPAKGYNAAKNPHVIYDIATGTAIQYVDFTKNSNYGDKSIDDIKILVTTSEDENDGQFIGSIGTMESDELLPLARIILGISDAYDFEMNKKLEVTQAKSSTVNVSGSHLIYVTSGNVQQAGSSLHKALEPAIKKQQKIYEGIDDV